MPPLIQSDSSQDIPQQPAIARRRGRPRGSRSMKTPVIHGHMQLRSRPTSTVAGRFNLCCLAWMAWKLTPISEHHTRGSDCDVRGRPQSIDRQATCTTSGGDASRRHGRQKRPKASGHAKQPTPQLSVEMERDSDPNTSHPLKNVTLTLSPTKKRTVVDFVDGDTSESEIGSEKDSNSESEKGSDSDNNHCTGEGTNRFLNVVLTIRRRSPAGGI